MSAFLSPIFGAGWQCFDNQGRVLNGGLLNTYIAGSVATPQPTWTTSTQAVQNANPIPLTSTGRFSQEMWLQAGVGYKFVLTDVNLNVMGTWDNITGVNDTTASQTEWLTTGLAATFVNATTFTVPGNQTNVYTANRRIQASTSAGTVYGYVVSATFGSPNTTVVVAIDAGALDSGLTIANVGVLNATNPSVPQSYFRSGVTLGGAVWFAKSTAIAAAATVDLSTATGNEVHITGNGGPITSFGTVNAGAEFTLVFDSNPTVTHNATSLIIPGAASATVAAGDVWKVVSEGAGNWRVVSYIKAINPIIGGGLDLIALATAAASATVDFTAGITATYDEYLVTMTNVIPATDAALLELRVSEDGGSTFKAGAADYSYANARIDDTGGIVNAGAGSAAFIQLVGINGISNTAANGGISGELRFFGPAGTASNKQFNANLSCKTATNYMFIVGGGQFKLDTNAINGIRFLMSAGNITSGKFALYGVRKT